MFLFNLCDNKEQLDRKTSFNAHAAATLPLCPLREKRSVKVEGQKQLVALC